MYCYVVIEPFEVCVDCAEPSVLQYHAMVGFKWSE